MKIQQFKDFLLFFVKNIRTSTATRFKEFVSIFPYLVFQLIIQALSALIIFSPLMMFECSTPGFIVLLLVGFMVWVWVTLSTIDIIVEYTTKK